MHVQCPHCQNPIELVELRENDEILCPSCGSSFRLAHESTRTYSQHHLGRRLGRFELIAIAGTGSTGAVYKARDGQLDRLVAVKVPRAGNLQGPGDRDRFLREARSVARLRHPAIVPVHEVGQDGETTYLVSDYVEGVTLSDLLTARRPGFRESAELVARLADALQYAHEQGVVHRDVKPSNIMLDDAGRPHLMDFGLAKRDAGEITMTLDGQVLGTPAYMSPEQARGEGHTVDGRGDVYSLGVVLYLLLTGELPFRGTSRMLLHQVLHDEPRSPRGLNDRIPRDLETICLKAMAKEPHRRYATAGELSADLRRYLAGEPIMARPVGRLERSWRWAKRYPAAAGLLGVSVLAAMAMVGLVVGLMYNARLERAWKEEEQQRHVAETAQQVAEEQFERAERNLYYYRLIVAEREWQDGKIGRAEQLLDGCPVEQRGWEWHYLKRQCHAELLTLGHHSSFVHGVAFSPDGSRIASTSQDETVKLWDAETGQELRTLEGHSGPVFGIAFSPDGSRLASVSGMPMRHGEVKLWNVSTGQELLNIPGPFGNYCNVTFSPDGARLAATSGEIGRPGVVLIFDAETGQELVNFEGHANATPSARFSPDGRRVASAGGIADVVTPDFGSSELIVWDADTGAIVSEFDLGGASGGMTDVAFSPDGARIAAAGGQDLNVILWDADTGQRQLTMYGHTQMVNGVAFSADGTRLASCADDGVVKLWDMTTGQELITWRGHTQGIERIAFSPNGRTLATAGWDRTVKVWDATTDPRCLMLSGHRGRVWGVAFSPDGGRLASAGDDKLALVWDVARGREIARLESPEAPLWSVAFSPDGTILATAGGDWRLADQPGEVRLWHVARARALRSLPAHAGLAWSVAFSPDGRRLASAGGELHRPGEVKVWDVATGRELLELASPSAGFAGVAFSPNGTRIAGGCADQTVRVWDVATGREVHTLSVEGDGVICWDVAFSPDNRLLASSHYDRSVRVWDARTGQELMTLRGHTHFAYAVAFSPDGSRLASASGDKTIKLWDSASGQEVLTLRGHDSPFTNVAFSLNGHQLAAVGDDGIVRVWDATPWAEPSPASGPTAAP